MNYHESARTRKTGLSTLILNKLMSGGSVGSSIKGAISDRMQASVMGLKEKFDPLNIASKLTGGSRIGPALLGRMTGRSKEDIDYFAHNRRVHRFDNVMNKGQGSGDSRKSIEALENIYSFMVKTRESQIKDNHSTFKFENERQQANQRRHDEVMDVFNEATKRNRQAVKVIAKPKAVEKPPAAPPSAPPAPPKPGVSPKPEPARPAPPSAPAPAPAKPTGKPPEPAKPVEPVTNAKDAADAAKKAKDAKDAADAAKKAKDAKDAADAAKKAKDAKDAADAAKKAKDTAKKQEPAPAAQPTATPAPPPVTKPPTAQPSATKIITGAATATAVLTGREALATNISKYESGEKGYNAYNRGDFWLAKKDEGKYLQKNDIDFSKMTITDYLKRTNKKLKAGGLLDASDPNVLFAVGKYQLIPGTMKVMAEKLGLDPDKTYLNKDTQDMLFAKGLTTKGSGGRGAVDDYIGGKQGATRDAAILALAMEFASVGVPYDIKAKSLFKNTLPNVDLKKGETFYKAPGGFNKAHNSPEEVGAALDADRTSKAKLQTNNTTVGSSLNDSSMNNADMKKSLGQGSGAQPVVVNNTTNVSNRETTVMSGSDKNSENPQYKRQ
jgi:chemotaxis protein histidine kinase CheA